MSGRLVLVLTITTCSCVASTSREVREISFREADAGREILLDGRPSGQVEEAAVGCLADTTQFVAILLNAPCADSKECRAYRHGLAVEGLRACYPTTSNALSSKALATEFGRLADACGHATTYSQQPCVAAHCVQGRCQLDE